MVLWSGGYTNGGISAAVVEEPSIVEADESFGEGGSGDVLAGFFVGPLGFEGRYVSTGDEMGWILFVEKGFAGGVGVGAESGVAMDRVVFAVVEDDNSGFSEHGWRAYLGEAAIEVARAFGEDFDWQAVRVFNRSPVDEVEGGGEVDGSFAPIKPVFAVDPSGEKASVFEGRDNAAGLVFECVVLSAG